MKKLLFIAILGLIFQSSFAQKWAQMMQQPNANLYEIQKEFYSHKANREMDARKLGNKVDEAEEGENEENESYFIFKRWENFVAPRVYPSGDIGQLVQSGINYQDFLTAYNANNSSLKGGSNMLASTTWTPIGPFGQMGSTTKSGRLNFIRFHPAGTNTIYVGAPAGGLWKSTNGGTSWTTNTDNLAVIGCSDLAIDPTNANIMYLATGDGDAGDTRSIGVLKSTDGGATWATTGLTYGVSSNFLIRRLIINPTNTQILLAATNAGVWRTVNGGTNWSQVVSSGSYDVEFQPGNPNIVYTSGASFRRSTDGGATWTQISAGITTGAQRMQVAVTSNNANYVYAVAANGSNGFMGLYRSTDGGVNFTTMSTSPNILDWNNPPSGSSGQGWYDLALAASPLNANEVVVGGINVWRSTNGGSTWGCIGHWTGSGAPFIHADVHYLEYTTAGTLHGTSDGAVYRYTGSAWTDIEGTMNISQIYKIGCSGVTANKCITGHQDNGSNIWNGASYNASLGGDGMDCFIDRTNDNNMFAEQYNGQLKKSTNGGGSWGSCTSGLSGSANWVTPWKQDPQTANTIYVGLSTLWKSTNLGTSWTTMAALPVTTGAIIEFAVAPNNNQVIYVLKSSGIFKTTNGGTSWTTVTGSVPVGSGAPTFITIDPLDPNNAWVTLSGYSAGNKVFVTTNGGTSWTNFTANLPNIPANCSVYQGGTNDRIYVGMDVGVYYRDASSGTWTLYNTGLPNMPIKDMEISQAASSKIRAASYGRGVWEVDVLPANIPPASTFSVASAAKCAGKPIYLNDQSTNGPTSWSWTVTPMTGVTLNTSTSQNPTLTCNNAGTYTVSMIATNGAGSGPVTVQTIVVTPNPTVTVSLANQTVCANSNVTLTASGAAGYNWSSGGGNAATAVYNVVALSTYTVTGSTAGCTGTAVATVATKTLPVISATGSNTNLCIGQTTTLSASGAASYTWNPGNIVGATMTSSPSVSTTFTCSGTGANGCFGSTTINIFVSPCTGISQVVSNVGIYSVYPNPTSGKLTIQVPVNKAITVTAEMLDLAGKSILKQTINYSAGENSYNLNLGGLSAGMYFLKLNSSEGNPQIIRIIKD